MSKRDNNLDAVIRAGVSYDDAVALRRISMTLHRWFELECGAPHPIDPRWTIAIERDGDEDDSKPYLRFMGWVRGEYVDRRSPTPDKETGARKRLAKILERYPGWQAYVQTDPRGCALHLLRTGDIPEGSSASMCYSTRGIAVY